MTRQPSSEVLALYPEPLRSMVLAERVGVPECADLMRETLVSAERMQRGFWYAKAWP